MGEQLPKVDHEPTPRSVTGLFQLSVPNFRFERSPDGRVMPAKAGPRFAVKDVLVLHTEEGWKDFSHLLASHLEGDARQTYEEASFYSIAESPIDELTDNMAPGEIRLITPDEYKRAYLNQYGDVIQGPIIW